MTGNPLIKLIVVGRIHTLEDLKATYHKLVMQTHPDAVGSDRLLRKFIAFNDHYEEAKGFLAQAEAERTLQIEPIVRNHRLEFYKQLYLIESLEMPYAFHPQENRESIQTAKQHAAEELVRWSPGVLDLYVQADAELVRIKREKPQGPYLKHALAMNLRPVMHNLIAFQLSGQLIYARQSRQNLGAIMQKIVEGKYHSLHRFLTFLIEDLNNVAAVLE